MDLVPTVCDLTGLPIPRDVRGESLYDDVYDENFDEAPDIGYHLIEAEKNRIGFIPSIGLVFCLVLGVSLVTFDPRKWLKFLSGEHRPLKFPLRNHQPPLVFLMIVLSITVENYTRMPPE